MVQWVKDSALSLQRLRSLMWHWFGPWPGNFLYAVGTAPPPKKNHQKTNKQIKTNLKTQLTVNIFVHKDLGVGVSYVFLDRF